MSQSAEQLALGLSNKQWFVQNPQTDSPNKVWMTGVWMVFRPLTLCCCSRTIAIWPRSCTEELPISSVQLQCVHEAWVYATHMQVDGCLSAAHIVRTTAGLRATRSTVQGRQYQCHQHHACIQCWKFAGFKACVADSHHSLSSRVAFSQGNGLLSMLQSPYVRASSYAKEVQHGATIKELLCVYEACTHGTCILLEIHIVGVGMTAVAVAT